MLTDTRRLLAKWGLLIQSSEHIFTWTEPETLAFLAELASTAGHIVESGCYLGRSAKVMLDAGTAHLWTADKFMVAGTELTTRYFLRKEIKEGRAEIIVGDSERAAQMLGPHMTGKVDLIFIDDGHASEDVQRDIRSLMPLLRPGGVMLGHDYDKTNDVAQGVHASGIKFDVPIPRVWRYIREN